VQKLSAGAAAIRPLAFQGRRVGRQRRASAGWTDARIDAARGAQHGGAMIAEGLKVVCVQRVDERHIVRRSSNTRIVSAARIRLDLRKSVRPFKGIICDDISEFESHMPSHAVGLSQVRSPAIVAHR
jgi:hypothetical protein